MHFYIFWSLYGTWWTEDDILACQDELPDHTDLLDQMALRSSRVWNRLKECYRLCFMVAFIKVKVV